ncbi:hypothetical protein [Yersinia mollaretii]|uniref:hypothetical protein n=1 Tax=Yersinia mollaretii TaxID=33060 RepID=UPI001E547A4C|nr:hypothetical protein [Yersinia mollaretii]MDN0112180.1 hypothetical protein [Yersinia mollaretii]
MTITTLHSTLKMTATLPNSEPARQSNNIHLRVAGAWQTNTSGKTAATEQNKPTDKLQISATEQVEIDKFIESLRATPEKKEIFVLLNKKLRSLSSTERGKFIGGLVQTLKASDQPEVQDLLKEKFNPAYSMYIATDILVNQINQESLSKIGQAPREDDDEDDLDEI